MQVETHGKYEKVLENRVTGKVEVKAGLILHQIFLVNEYEVNISRTALVGPRS